MRIPLLAFVCWARTDYALDVQSTSGAVAYSPIEALASALFALHTPRGLHIRRGVIPGIANMPCSSHRNGYERNSFSTPISSIPRVQTGAKMVVSPSTSTLRPPRYRGEMLDQAVSAVQRARSDGVTRFTLRTFLPRGEGLSALDESWEGGIMQLYARCSPLVRELLSKLSKDVAGVPPSLTEQRLDTSGVDGESVWIAQSANPEDDAVALVQPSAERREDIRRFSEQAGLRPVLMINPQWKMLDDPFDATSRQGGLLGALGNALGGKAAFEKELTELGFLDVYALQEYVTRGSRIILMLSYPYGWSAFYFDIPKDTYVELFSGAKARPRVSEVDQALIDSNVPFRFNEFQNIV